MRDSDGEEDRGVELHVALPAPIQHVALTNKTLNRVPVPYRKNISTGNAYETNTSISYLSSQFSSDRTNTWPPRKCLNNGKRSISSTIFHKAYLRSTVQVPVAVLRIRIRDPVPF